MAYDRFIRPTSLAVRPHAPAVRLDASATRCMAALSRAVVAARYTNLQRHRILDAPGLSDGQRMGSDGKGSLLVPLADRVAMMTPDGKGAYLSFVGDRSVVRSAEFKPYDTGKALMTTNQSMRLFDINQSTETTLISESTQAAAFVDTNTVVIADVHGTHIVDLRQHKTTMTLHRRPTTDVAVMGHVIATACDDRRVRVTDMRTGGSLWCTSKQTESCVRQMVFRPSSKQLAVICGDRNVYIYNERCSLLRSTTMAHPTTSISWGADGGELAVGNGLCLSILRPDLTCKGTIHEAAVATTSVTHGSELALLRNNETLAIYQCWNLC